MDLGKLIIQIVVQGDKAVAEVLGFEKAVKRTADKVEENNKRAGLSFAKVGDFAQKAFFTIQTVGMALRGLETLSQKANEAEQAERRLEGASKLAGVSLDKMRADAQAAKEELGLTTVQSNLITESLTKLGSKAGDISKTQEATARLLDLAAARGYDASQALTAIDQAILGIDEGTDKLFGKNPSAIYAEYAAQIGTTAGMLDDQQKAQALLNAVMNDGLKVQGSYQDFLRSNAGQQALMAARADEMQAKFGLLYNQLKSIVMQVAMPILSFFAEMDTGLLAMITMLVGTIALLVKLPAILGGISAALKALGVSATIATGPIGIIISVIGVLASLWVSNLFGIQDATKKAFQYISAGFTAIGEVIKIVIERIVQRFTGLATIIKSALKADWDGIKAGAKQVADSYVGGWGDSIERVKDRFNSSLDDIKVKKEQVKNDFKKSPIEIVTSTSGAGAGAFDPEAAKKAEEDRKALASLRITNMTNEYARQKALVEAAYNEEVLKYAGNTEILKELKTKRAVDIEAIEAGHLQKEQDTLQKQTRELADIRLQSMSEGKDKELAKLELWYEQERMAHANQTEYLAELERLKGTKLAEITKEFRTKEEINNQTLIDTMESSTGDFLQGVLTGHKNAVESLKSAWDSFKNRFINNLIDMALEGNSFSKTVGGILDIVPGGNIIGTAIKGIGKIFGFAEGGIINRPELILAGERGPEIIVPQQNFEAVLRAMQLRGAIAATARGDFSPVVSRLDRLEESIRQMQFVFNVDSVDLATANETGMRIKSSRVV